MSGVDVLLLIWGSLFALYTGIAGYRIGYDAGRFAEDVPPAPKEADRRRRSWVAPRNGGYSAVGPAREPGPPPPGRGSPSLPGALPPDEPR